MLKCTRFRNLCFMCNFSVYFEHLLSFNKLHLCFRASNELNRLGKQIRLMDVSNFLRKN